MKSAFKGPWRHLPEPDDDLRSSVKVAQVPTDDGRPNETGKDGFAFVVTGRRNNQMRHPRTHLKTKTNKWISDWGIITKQRNVEITMKISNKQLFLLYKHYYFFFLLLLNRKWDEMCNGTFSPTTTAKLIPPPSRERRSEFDTTINNNPKKKNSLFWFMGNKKTALKRKTSSK